MRAAFLEWAKASLAPLSTVRPGTPWDDLETLGAMIGEATVVALSEGAHAAAEPLEFRNRSLEYLVREKGFTAVAIESGLVEGRVIHEYVRGGAGDLDQVLTQGISWGHDQLPQNRALVSWLKEYNAEPGRSRKVNFYGFDVPGCPSSTRAYFGHDAALNEVLRFLSRVDESARGVFRARLDAFMSGARFHSREPDKGPCYGKMSSPERDALTATIADLIIWLERHEAKYTSANTVDEYAWAYRAAIGARQMDNWMRQVPTEGMPSTAQAAFSVRSDKRDVRDRAQADNIEWIARREGPSGKVLVFAARYHLSAASLKASWHPHRQECGQEVAGTYLRRRFGKQLLTIGNLIGRGEVACGDYAQTLEKVSAHSLDGLAGDVGVPLFLLDLRRAPLELTPWLHEEHQLATGLQVLKLPLVDAFDILFYIEAVTPACESAPRAWEA